MNVLVTGGCGFIGSNLSKSLALRGDKVTIVDDMSSGTLDSLHGLDIRVTFADFLSEFSQSVNKSRDATVIQGDFAHPQVLQSVADGDFDVVFHQAAIPRVLFSVENPIVTTHNNVAKTVELMTACKDSKTRFIFASSSSVYGGADVLPTPETHAKDPKSPYAWQKSAIEDLISVFCSLYEFDAVCLRYFNVFGPGQLGDSPYSTAISAWCHAIKHGLPMRSDGDGEQTRDLCYIDNVVQANILAASKEERFTGQAYNIACGDQTSNNQILAFFSEKFSNLHVNHAPERLGDVKHTRACIEKARSELGYSPTHDFWEGLEKTVEWWGLNEY